MKKIVPFKKDIVFENNVVEITSISLEHTLHLEGNLIKGEFILTGDYKMTETSINTEKFSYNLPFQINVDSKYILDNVTLDIDDFYYEIINDNVLSINIEVLIDKLEEKQLFEEIEESVKEPVIDVLEKKEEIIDNPIREEIQKEERCIEEETSSIFSNITSSEKYATYKVYIVRENDNIEQIITNYSVTKEELEQYNDLNDIKIGDKIIIPYNAKV